MSICLVLCARNILQLNCNSTSVCTWEKYSLRSVHVYYVSHDLRPRLLYLSKHHFITPETYVYLLVKKDYSSKLQYFYLQSNWCRNNYLYITPLWVSFSPGITSFLHNHVSLFIGCNLESIPLVLLVPSQHECTVWEHLNQTLFIQNPSYEGCQDDQRDNMAEK